MFHSSQVLALQQVRLWHCCSNTGATPMTRLFPKFFAKKAVIQVSDIDIQAQAALQIRVSRMLQHHIATGDVSVSPQIIHAL
jgi:hypothetical protein